MNLIEVLACGVAGAEDGTATVYRRGTTIRSTLYADAEATSQIPSAQLSANGDLLLDENGGRTVYVNESVDVTVKDASGDTVRVFTSMQSSPLVEYSGPSFTGTNYQSAATGVNLPVSLKTILDLWQVSAGATDFKVLFQGAPTLLQTALAFADIYYNVQAVAYGAQGDGVTDDVAAIQAAIDAANLAGGGTVFFPQGIYRVTSALSLKANVSLLGLGSQASQIKMDAAAAVILSVTASASMVSVTGLRIYNAQTNASILVDIPADAFITIRDCLIGGANSTGTFIDIAASAVESLANILFCDFDINASTAKVLHSDVASPGQLMFLGNRVVTSGTALGTTGVIELEKGTVVGNSFDAGTISSGNFSWLLCGSGGAAAFLITCVGNAFEPAGGAANVIIFNMDITGGVGRFMELANDAPFNSSSFYSIVGTFDQTAKGFRFGLRESRETTELVSASPHTLDNLSFEHVKLDVTGLTALTVNHSGLLPTGSRLTVHIAQDSTGTLTVTWGTGFLDDGNLSIAADKSQTVEFVCRAHPSSSSALLWVQVAAPTADM